MDSEVPSNPLERSLATAWNLIRRYDKIVFKAATRMNDVKTEAKADSQGKAVRGPLSRLEKLPEEIQVYIMKCLDHESLYRLSQTTTHFLRLSFDPTFEADPGWRAFRHTVDGLGEGPRKRILEGASLGMSGSTTTESHEQKPRSSSPPHPWAQNTAESDSAWQSSSETRGQVVSDGSDDEGETMHSFMAKQNRK